MGKDSFFKGKTSCFGIKDHIFIFINTNLFHSFSGAENETRDIHPLQGLPLYWEDAT